MAKSQESENISSELQAWVGTWEGPFEIYTSTGLKDSLEMKLVIEPENEGNGLIWNTLFTQGERIIEKPYFLYRTDQKNVFTLDEKNSIKIPQYLLGDEMISFYEVMGSRYMVLYRLQDETSMQFSIVIIPEVEPSISGGEPDSDIPEVKSYKVSMTQTAKLKKVK